MRKVLYTVTKNLKNKYGFGKKSMFKSILLFVLHLTLEELGSFCVEGFVALQVIRLKILQVCTDSIRDLAPKPFLLLSFFCLFVPPTLLPSLLTSPYYKV